MTSETDILKIESYNFQNKECTQPLPLLPDYLKESKDNIEIAHWLLVENLSNWAWFELDIQIDVATWEKELDGVYNKFIHQQSSYSDQSLYESLMLYDYDKPNQSIYDNQFGKFGYNTNNIPSVWTEHVDQCPVITDFWKNKFPVEKWDTIRFLKLKSGGYLMPHVDKTPEEAKIWNILTMDIGINMSITHPLGCEIWFEGFGRIPFKPGKFFLYNTSKLHWVHNFTPYDRVHMGSIGSIGNQINAFCNLIVKSYLKQTNQIL